MNAILSPKSLHQITQETEAAKAREELAQKKKQEEEQRRLHDAFMAQDIAPNADELVNAAVRRAAEQGKTEVQIFVFPASYTNDHGRRINNGDPDWPDSLEGFAKRAFEYYSKELAPLHFRAEARVLSYPDGIPGDIGVFLKW
jgi:hypothetical protein